MIFPKCLLSLITATLLVATSAQDDGSIYGLRCGIPGDDSVTTGAAPMWLDLISLSTRAVEGINLSSEVLGYAASNAEGVISLSGDGTLLVLTGYGAELGFDFPASSSWSTVPRIIAAVDCDGAHSLTPSVARVCVGASVLFAAVATVVHSSASLWASKHTIFACTTVLLSLSARFPNRNIALEILLHSYLSHRYRHNDPHLGRVPRGRQHSRGNHVRWLVLLCER